MKRSRSLGNLKKIDNVAKTYLSAVDAQCPICKDILLFPCTLGCGHNFCYQCLKQLHSHIHNNAAQDDSSDDDDGDIPHVGDILHVVSPPPYDNLGTSNNIFYNRNCFNSVMLGKTQTKFMSELVLNKDKLQSHILRDCVFCDNCPDLTCPTCRLNVKVLPKPNIMMHENLKTMLGPIYENRMNDYLIDYSATFILKQYEKSQRYTTIKMLLQESIQAIEQAITFTNFMEAFSAYGPEEIVWCLNKLKEEKMFLIVKDLIISRDHYSSDFNKLLLDNLLASEDINYLLMHHPDLKLGNSNHDTKLIADLKKRFKGTRKGILKLLDDKELLDETMRKFLINNDMFD